MTDRVSNTSQAPYGAIDTADATLGKDRKIGEMHPVQVHARRGLQSPDRPRAQAPAVVTLRAYEVYCHVYGAQPAMVDLKGRDCRGGFGVGELMAFLYARSFPKEEWRTRVDEAFRGLDLDCRS